jgi:glycerol-3-phosphate dehydrogenase
VESREETLERLEHERFDLLVVGGGILGAGIAEVASRHGLAVALVERDDFASGTTSASSKLVHGGLRYLRMGHLSLVREALGEVDALSRHVAPHLVRRIPFVLPVYAGGPYGRMPIRGALWSYAQLTGTRRERGRLVAPAAAAALVPSLRTEGLRAAGIYPDARTDDARLCLLNLRAAAEAGAAVASRVELVGLERGAAQVRDVLTGSAAVVRAGAVVNATGASVDAVRRLEDPAAGSSVTLSKGAHLVLALPEGWRAAVTIPVDRSRVSFAVPWQGLLLLGTTDTAWEGDPADVRATDEDERQILAEAGLALDGLGAVRARFAGLRVLPAGADGETARVRRETVLTRGPLGVVSVTGGKLTTYRRIALAVLHALRSDLALHRIDREPRPLPGAADPDVAAAALRRRHGLDPAAAAQLAGTYGSLAVEVLAHGPLDPVVDGAPELAAQVPYAREREWALTVDDVLRRRTTLALRGLDGPDVRARVEGLLA